MAIINITSKKEHKVFIMYYLKTISMRGFESICTMPIMWLSKCVRVVLVENVLINS